MNRNPNLVENNPSKMQNRISKN